jgi:hypothetical protein
MEPKPGDPGEVEKVNKEPAGVDLFADVAESDPGPESVDEVEKAKEEPVRVGKDLFAGLYDEDDVFDPRERVEMAMEASKGWGSRREDIVRALDDEQNELVVKGRGVGRKIAEGEIISKDDIAELLTVRSSVEQIVGNTDRGSRLRLLTEERDALIRQDGSQSISRELNQEEATADEGERRKGGEERAILIQAILLGVGETELKNGNLEEGVVVLKSAHEGTHSKLPNKSLESLSTAVEAADLEDDTQRKVLVDHVARNSGWLGVNQQAEKQIREYVKEGKAGEEVPMGVAEKIVAKGMEASTIQTRIEREEQARKEKEEYEGKMKEWVGRKMSAAMELSRSEINAVDVHYREPKNVEFPKGLQGGQVIAKWREARINQEKIFGDNRWGGEPKGIGGRIEVLRNVWFNKEVRDKLVAYNAENSFGDHGGRSKDKYEEAGQTEEWRSLHEQELEAEVKGQAMGALLEIMDKPKEWDKADRDSLRSVLELLGEGNVVNNIMRGLGDLSEIDVHLNGLLAKFFGDKQEESESGDEKISRLAKLVLGRLPDLRRIAQQVDERVEVKNMEREIKEAEKTERDEKERERLEGEVEKGLKMMEEWDLVREDLEGVNELVGRMDMWGNEPFEALITILGDDKKGETPLSFTVNKNQLDLVTQMIIEREESLDKGEGDESVLKQQLREVQLKKIFLEEIGRLLASSDGYKRERTAKTGVGGFRRKQVGVIKNDFFDRITSDNDYGVNSTLLGQVRSLINTTGDKRNDGYAGGSKETSKTELKSRLKGAIGEDVDILQKSTEIGSSVRQVEQKDKEIVESRRKLQTGMEDKARSIARGVVKKRLYENLRKKGRVAYN